jgi:glucose/arabinose dehydrogenase
LFPRFILILGLSLVLWAGLRPSPTQAQLLPPCHERPTHQDPPWVDGKLWCLERVYADPGAGELAFSALAVGDDGTLYAARPLDGEVYAFDHTDDDLLPDRPRLVVDGLTLPNGLAYHDGWLYISGGAHIYRWRDSSLETLVDDLPAGATGFWTGGIVIGDDERIYVATGAACDFCESADPERGAILSFALDGSDKQVIATGLRHPADLAFLNGELWTVDTARDGLAGEADLDELNRVVPGGNFGWPYCKADNLEDMPGADCGTMQAPALRLPTHSRPIGLAAYESDTFPFIQNSLLVVLSGALNDPNPRALGLFVIPVGDNGNLQPLDILIPRQSGFYWSSPELALERINHQGSGFWPRRPLDVAVSPEGWIYVSVSGGSILALRG